jgi:hypothetical protein
MTDFAKSVCLLALLFLIFCSAIADLADAAPEGAALREEDSIWISLNTENTEGGQEQKLQLYPARSLTLDLEPSGGEMDGLSVEIDPDELAETESESLEYLPKAHGTYDAGFEIRTYRLFGSDADLSPAIIMVNERRTDERFYFGFLSISIRF